MIKKEYRPTFFKILLIVFLVIQVEESKAQERMIIEGEVTVDSIQDLSGIHIVNLTGETGTTTNTKGQFKMDVRIGDTLFFSSIQFEHQKIKISEKDLGKKLTIRLREKFNELEEVQLDDIKLSGVLSGDIHKVPKSIYEKLGMPFPKPRPSSLEISVQSATGGGPLLTILNTLNGSIKQLEKAEENYEVRSLVYKGLDIFGVTFFTSQLDIPEEEVINFLYYCSDHSKFSDLIKEEKVLLLVELFKNQTESFKELRELN